MLDALAACTTIDLRETPQVLHRIVDVINQETRLTVLDHLSAGAKVGWAIGMLIVPFIGLLLYTMLRPADSQIAQRRRT